MVIDIGPNIKDLVEYAFGALVVIVFIWALFR